MLHIRQSSRPRLNARHSKIRRRNKTKQHHEAEENQHEQHIDAEAANHEGEANERHGDVVPALRGVPFCAQRAARGVGGEAGEEVVGGVLCVG